MKKESKRVMAAVAGQPNSGKSTIFNMLTGARQHVANYPGVTVEKKTGVYRYNGDTVDLVDLPGTYSLTSYTQEERIARDFLLQEKPSVVIDIVDASNLERNLYLTFQLMEIGSPLVIALNMMDVAERRGFKIDIQGLSSQLKALVVPTVGNRGKGKKEVKEAVWKTYNNAAAAPFRIDYGDELEHVLSSLEERLSGVEFFGSYSPRWLGIKLLENDREAWKLVERAVSGKER